MSEAVLNEKVEAVFKRILRGRAGVVSLQDADNMVARRRGCSAYTRRMAFRAT